MKLREIFRSENYYSVCECDGTKRKVIYVLAGGIMMYQITVVLTLADEIEFKLKGHLDALARDICKNEEKYTSRMLLPKTSNEKIQFVDAI